MYFINVLLCVFVFSVSEISCEFASRRCFDCVSIRSCKSALDFARRVRQGTASRQTFIDAVCGTDRQDHKIPKVCCSDFAVRPIPVPTTTAIPTTNRFFHRFGHPSYPTIHQIPTSIPIDHIETHPNIRLLPTSCGDIEGSRIINGRTPKLYELPWMTLIGANKRYGVEFECGGSIISSRYILTAAHCVTNGYGVLKNIDKVRVGEFDTSRRIDCQGDYENMICETKLQDIDVEEIIPHESFTKHSQEGDIALLRLKQAINITNNASPICLPVYSDLLNTNLAGKKATIAGWGRTESRAKSSTLLKAEVPILTSDQCTEYYNRYVHQRHSLIEKSFCAGDMVQDSCDGDSGGPLILESEYNSQVRFVQFGIVSFGPVQCGSNFPGFYTDVTKYMDWILDNIRA